MRVEFRTLDGAIAMREVAEPLPPLIHVPLVQPHYTTATEIARAETRVYELIPNDSPPCNCVYREVSAPPAHAAEIERIAGALLRNYELGNGGKFLDALSDLRSLGKRYFAHTEGKEALEKEAKAAKYDLGQLQNVLAAERAAHAETKRELSCEGVSDCKCGCPEPILHPTRDAWVVEAVARKADTDIMADLLDAERAAHAETNADLDRANAAWRTVGNELTCERAAHAETKRERDLLRADAVLNKEFVLYDADNNHIKMVTAANDYLREKNGELTRELEVQRQRNTREIDFSSRAEVLQTALKEFLA